MVLYQYSATNDTQNGEVVASILDYEIKESQDINVDLDRIDIAGDTIKIYFPSDLNLAETSVLTSIVNNHTGVIPPDDPPQEEEEPPDSSDDESSGYHVGSVRIDTATNEAYILVDPTEGAAVWKKITGSDTVYYYNENYQGTTHTNTGWEDIQSWTTPSLPSGRYRVGWSYLWSGDASWRNFNGQILVDSTRIHLHQQEPAESGYGVGPVTPGAGTDQCMCNSGFAFIDLTEGSHIIKLQSRTDFWNDEVTVHRSVLEIQRVGEATGVDPSQNLTDTLQHQE